MNHLLAQFNRLTFHSHAWNNKKIIQKVLDGGQVIYFLYWKFIKSIWKPKQKKFKTSSSLFALIKYYKYFFEKITNILIWNFKYNLLFNLIQLFVSISFYFLCIFFLVSNAHSTQKSWIESAMDQNLFVWPSTPVKRVSSVNCCLYNNLIKCLKINSVLYFMTCSRVKQFYSF